ncbi:Homeodomain-like protein [Blakeslea trispora]|nr:Homeodomain-like protein [Blakeslea trispora]
MDNRQLITPVISNELKLSTKAKRRMRTSREETAILESYYKQNPNPNHERKQEIAEAVNMGARNVHFWFQNRRAKDNKRKKMLKQQIEQERFHTLLGLPSASDNAESKLDMEANCVQRQQSTSSSFSRFNQTNINQMSSSQRQKGKFKLPPISTIMAPNNPGISIPFYYHHSNFGIEDSMIQLAYLQDHAQNYSV